MTTKVEHINNALIRAQQAMGAGDKAMAEEAFAIALQIEPKQPLVLRELARLCSTSERLPEAEQLLRLSLSYAPYDAITLVELGGTLSLLGKHEECGEALRRALAIAPFQPSAMWNYGLWLLKEGCTERERPGHFHNPCWLEGWQHYKWGVVANSGRRHRTCKPAIEFLKGRSHDSAGKTLLIWAEQGFGDTFQFIRFLPAVRDIWKGRIAFEVQPDLLNILAGQVPVDELFAHTSDGSIPVAWDEHVGLMDLPGVLGLDPHEVPTAPYLVANPDKAAGFNAGMAGNYRVGICWAGNRANPNDYMRSLPQEALVAFNGIPGVTFHTLQVGVDAPEGESHLSSHLFDWSDTAAAIANLDLVISVDTAVAHLAGAMGKPVWLMLPVNNDWRWGKKGNTCLWYPSARLFRQAAPGDWMSVVNAIADELRALDLPPVVEEPAPTTEAPMPDTQPDIPSEAPSTVTTVTVPRPVIDVDTLADKPTRNGARLQLTKGAV